MSFYFSFPWLLCYFYSQNYKNDPKSPKPYKHTSQQIERHDNTKNSTTWEMLSYNNLKTDFKPSLSQWWTLICGEENSQQSPGLSCWEPWQCRWFHRKARAGRTGPRSTRLGSTDSLWPCVCSHVVPHSRAPSVPPSSVRAAGPVHLPATRGNAKPALQLGGRQHHSGDTSIII